MQESVCAWVGVCVCGGGLHAVQITEVASLSAISFPPFLSFVLFLLFLLLLFPHSLESIQGMLLRKTKDRNFYSNKNGKQE